MLKRLVFVLALIAFGAGIVQAQVSTSPMPVPKYQFFNAAGKPLAFGIVCTYQSGGVTPLATYTDYTGTVANATCPTPNTGGIVLDSGGFANIWLAAYPYKIVVQDAQRAVVWTVDGVRTLPTAGFPTNTKYCESFAGATFDVKVNACLAAVVALGGGTADARGLTGAQTISATIVIPDKVRLLVAPVTGTSTVTPIFHLDKSCGLFGSGGLVEPGGYAVSLFYLSGTVGGSAVVFDGPGIVSDISIVGVSTSDGSIGFDLSSNANSAQLSNSTAKDFQVDYQIGGGGVMSGYVILRNLIAQGNAQYGFLHTGNAASLQADFLSCQSAQTCFEFDTASATVSHLNAESFTVDAVAFAGIGNTISGVYIESGPTAFHYKTGAIANTVVGGHMSSITGPGIVFDGSVDQITNWRAGIAYDAPGGFPLYWGTSHLLMSGGTDPYIYELLGGVSFANRGQAFIWSANSYTNPPLGHQGYAPLGVGGLENYGGLKQRGSLAVTAIVSGGFPAPIMTCDSSGTGTTYTAYVVAYDYNGNKTLPSSAGTIDCPNVPSVTHPVSVTPAVAWGSEQAQGVMYYDYLWGDTAHSFALASQGAKTFISDLTLSAAADHAGSTTLYTGTITGGAANALAGRTFTVSGFTTPANNGGPWLCSASTASTITLANGAGAAETHAGLATILLAYTAPTRNATGDASVSGNTSVTGTLSVGGSEIVPIRKFSVEVSSAQLLALPHEILAAPGSGKMYVVTGAVWEYKAGATPYAGTSTYIDLVPTGTGFLNDAWSYAPMNLLTNAADRTTQMTTNILGGMTSLDPAALNNKGISVVADGTVINGNGTLWVTVYYTVETIH